MPAYKNLTSRKAVIQALTEYDRVTGPVFLSHYGFSPAQAYFLRHDNKTYDSKAIVGVAYGIQFPENGPLKSEDFSGVKRDAGRHLSMLGFDVDGISRRENDWTLEEVEAVVDAYFTAYQSWRHGTYNRRVFILRAADAVGSREKGAIERKVSNICAILKILHLPYLSGFGALGNKQTLLTAIVIDWLNDHPESFDFFSWVAPPETSNEVPAPNELTLSFTSRERKACRVDFAERDARNRELGKRGEDWAVAALKAELIEKGRPDLALRIEWVSSTQGDGLGYDIRSFTLTGSEIAVEVKTTNAGIAAPFLVTANEIRASHGTLPYVLMRIFNFSSAPRFYRLAGALDEICDLQPATYRALPNGDAEPRA